MKFVASTLLAQVPFLRHGFGQRIAGTREVARAAARSAYGADGEVFFLRQVHGCAVVAPPWGEAPEADASFAKESGSFLAIETADCLPVLIVDPVRRWVAAAHAGWRGTVARVSQAAARALVVQGSDPGDLLVALGPSIGACCYEVGPEVEEALGPDGGSFFVAGNPGKKRLNVAAANRAQLLEMGVKAKNLDLVELCTRCREDLFFSYRRDGANAGRMISLVGFSRPST